jgi:GTP cyclohydrolase I
VKPINNGLIEQGVRQILKGLNIDPADRNFIDTPERVARLYVEMFGKKEVEYATFPEDFTDFIMLKGHVLYSMCPHHLLPVRFTVSLAYIPAGEVLGLSKLIRVLDECNTRPLLQEGFTRDAVARLQSEVSGVKDVACLVSGKHGCTEIRGVRSPGDFTTYHLEGAFRDDPKMESRFFQLAGRP